MDLSVIGHCFVFSAITNTGYYYGNNLGLRLMSLFLVGITIHIQKNLKVRVTEFSQNSAGNTCG